MWPDHDCSAVKLSSRANGALCVAARVGVEPAARTPTVPALPKIAHSIASANNSAASGCCFRWYQACDFARARASPPFNVARCEPTRLAILKRREAARSWRSSQA
jgi:hypothetical protein